MIGEPIRNTLKVIGLSVALLAVAASSASAVVFSPPSIDFGSQPTYTKSPGQIVTLTKESRFLQEDVFVDFYPDRFKGFSNLTAFQGTSNCPALLTNSYPSCTMTVYFTPTLLGGTQGLTVRTDDTDPSKPTLTATGAGTKPCAKKRKKNSNAPLRYKKKCKGFPFFDPN